MGGNVHLFIVETPILGNQAGGANATPFVTRSISHHRDFFLRIAPELYLKKLVVGGMERVFEIGKQFRNEGIDSTHHPEFTTCELYAAYTDYQDLMQMTEEILQEIVQSVTGSSVVQWKSATSTSPDSVGIDFSSPFRRVDVWEELQRKLGDEHVLPSPEELHTEQAKERLMDIATRRGVTVGKPHTPSRIIDKLVGEFIEKDCVQPTFLCNHPRVMSPLARSCSGEGQGGLVERFELFIAQHEFVNAYSELSDPDEQRRRFQQQMIDRNEGDSESQVHDESYCRALEYGLPPTGGWGLGIDRLCMLLTGQTHLREIIPFPLSRVSSPGTKP